MNESVVESDPELVDGRVIELVKIKFKVKNDYLYIIYNILIL